MVTLTPSTASRRQYPRVPADSDIEVVAQPSVSDDVKLIMVNLSIGGAAIVASSPLGGLDDQVHLRVRNLGGREWGAVSYRLLYVIGEKNPAGAESQWLHGGEFTDLTGAAWEFVHRYVGDHLESTIGPAPIC